MPGTTLRIVRPLGYGGMGAVYEVEQTFTEIRYVLKVIHPELITGKGMLARMEKEAKLLAKLKHANIVQVVWAGLTDESPPLFYHVMEKLEGYTLRRLIRKAKERGIKIRIDFILRMMISLLNALAYAHAHGIIHRDIKPDNVFVHIGEIIKLLDFGIVFEIGMRRTTSRGFVGTLGYGATEQITGGELTPATDLWAVGVVLFELLTCCEPFGTAPTEYAMAQAVLFKPCVRPSELRPDIPPSLDDLILRLLEKDPAKRPSHASDVALELERIRAELAELPSPGHADLMGLDLMDSIGPPSITNVEEDLEEEVPPSSELQTGDPKGPARQVQVEGAQALGVAPRKATDLLSPSVVEHAVRKAAPAYPPPSADSGASSAVADPGGRRRRRAGRARRGRQRTAMGGARQSAHRRIVESPSAMGQCHTIAAGHADGAMRPDARDTGAIAERPQDSGARDDSGRPAFPSAAGRRAGRPPFTRRHAVPGGSS